MTKAQLKKEASGKWVVRDTRSGRFLEIRGADALKSSKLTIKKGVDLTKPIAKQALKEKTYRGVKLQAGGSLRSVPFSASSSTKHSRAKG
jgi:hypothetical protein